jgi:tetratricopeptide (TPR) repeat protein
LVQFKKAIEVDPTYAYGFSSIADHYSFVSGELDKAVVWLRKSVSVDPGTAMYPAWLTWIYLDLGDLDGAEYWTERSVELGPKSGWSHTAMEMLNLYRGDEAAALESAHKVIASDLGFSFAVQILRDHELRARRYTNARALFEKSYPELLNNDPRINNMNYQPAISLALVLSKSGEQEQADLLLERSLQYIETIPRLGAEGYWIWDVPIYALRGDKQKALAALRQAIDEGWRTLWWYFLKRDPSLELLHGEPEFQAMIAEIEADMAAQLERVREMERRGELVLPAELPAPRDHASDSSPRDLQ